jgi:hypothetical protein
VTAKWPEDPEQEAILLRELPVADPAGWVIAIAEGRTEESDVIYDWAWAWAAKRVASSRPELLLAFLTALRPIALEVKRRALDDVGETLAIALLERPTLAECRAAIGEADAAPRTRRIFHKVDSPPDVDATLVAFVLDALGCAAEPLVRRPDTATGPELDRTPHSNKFGQSRLVTSRLSSPSCTVVVERDEEFFPGDVNEPAREWTRFSVCGTRGDEAKVTVRAHVGVRDMWIDVDAAPDERDRILAMFWRAFAWVT